MPEKTLRAADLPRLVVQLPDGKEVHHSVVESEITIGRDPSNRIPIDDHFVSKFHAKLLISESTITLVDLGSANKTFVNGEPIRESAVRYGDQLQFAGVRCRLLAPGAEQEAPSTAPPSPPPPRGAPGSARRIAPRSRGRSAPRRIEADPRKRLLRMGGLLIGVSLALGVLLWFLGVEIR
jgi:hypothetical protein